MASVETARSRRDLIEEAGWSTTSGISALAGTLAAFGAVALIAAGAGAAGSALGLDTEGISTSEWRRAGIAGAAVGSLVLFGAFFMGGYTAGRMGRRAGARHGVLVFLMSTLLIGTILLIGWAMSGSLDVNLTDDLREQGVPTDRNTWGDIGIGAGIAAGVSMLFGSILGGIRGDRWHGRLASAVVEHREADRVVVDEDVAHDGDLDDDEPVERTETLDLRDHREISVEEERERTRAF